MAKSVAVNVGVNTNPEWGGFRGPIFSNGSFEFIHIPWDEEKYGKVETIESQPQKYKDMNYKSYVPKTMLDEFLVESPNFKINAYASSEGATNANKAIQSLKEKEDFLLFYATLQFKGEEQKREYWINPQWGAYIVGLFRIDLIRKRSGILFDEPSIEAFQEYDFFQVLLNQPDPFNHTPWIKGMEGQSGLLKKAIPLSPPEDPGKWSDLACKLFTTTTGRRLDVNEKAKFNWVLRCDDECLDELLTKCALREN